MSGSLLGSRPLLFYVLARGVSECACQMVAVAMGWHVYALTGSALDLGVVRLLQFTPTALLGRMATVAVALLGMKWFPELRNVDRLE